MDRGSPRSRAGMVWAVLVALVFGGVGAWSLRTLIERPADLLDAPAYASVEAQDGHVERVISLNVVASWQAASVVANQAPGTVTSVGWRDGELASPGDELYSVDLRPVAVAAGEVPAFRDLVRGDRGEDVAQLQAMLEATGYEVSVDGEFGLGLDEAVRAWQRDRGLAVVDGIVRLGDVLFVGELPAPVALDEQVAVGAVLSGGENAVRVLRREPELTIPLPDGQSQLIEAGMAVEVAAGDAGWSAVVGRIEHDAESGSIAVLEPPDGQASICADECDQVGLGTEATLLSSEIHVVPRVVGVTVPAAALVTDARADAGVVSDDGEFLAVTLVECASGLCVVEGVTAGDRLRVPGLLPGEPQGDPP